MSTLVKTHLAELGQIKVHHMEKGLFVFHLEYDELNRMVLEKGPWSFSPHPLILRPWKVGMPLYKPEVDHLHIWVQFSGLPLDLWSPEALNAACKATQVYVPRRRTEVSQGREEARFVEPELKAEVLQQRDVKGDERLDPDLVENSVSRGVKGQIQDMVQNSMLIGAVSVPTPRKVSTVGNLAPIVEGSEGKSCASKSYASVVNTPMVIGGGSFLFSAIYGANVYVKRRTLWQSFVEVKGQGVPWLLVGDFNIIRDITLTSDSSYPPSIAIEEFNSCSDSIDVDKLRKRFKQVKQELGRLNKAHYSDISGRVHDCSERFREVQSDVFHGNLSLQNLDLEKNLRSELVNLSRAELEFMNSKERITWLEQGDFGTKFFSSSVLAY
ncbi:hypothetical protein LIER_26053 [Lithospermum erythrorhizon]|uniref:DUF4283 domain-containing protein n=1 Tax=Lithospermum erythrorhizon TaxID=34254 RepID=A0AAV3R716_LITER